MCDVFIPVRILDMQTTYNFCPGYAIEENNLRRYERQSVECYVNT